MADQGSTNSPRKTVSQDVVEAVNLLAQGKRNYMCGEVGHAVNQLQEACRLLCSQYGEVADECGDAYFWYGKALLEVARQEGGILGDAVPGVSSETSSQESNDDDNDDDDEDEDDQAADGNSSVNDGTVDCEEDGAQSEDIENEEADDASAAAAAASTQSKSDAVTDESASKTDAETNQSSTSADANNPKDQESTDNADDVSNLQLAWEMLECAKFIYKRNEVGEMKLKLADTYLKLGEIGMETEQYDQSINDLTDCLTIQQSLLSANDRRMAETRYQLGLACTFDKRYEAAVGHYRAAIAVIEAKMKQLAQVIAGEIPPSADVDPHGFDTPQQLAQKEMDELAGIVPDILAKIEDVEDERRNADRVMLAMRENLVRPGCSSQSSSFQSESAGFASSSLPFASSSFGSAAGGSVEPVNNISHLVRKKRKSDEESSDAAKRCKLTTVTAGAVEDHSNLLTTATEPSSVDNSTLENGNINVEHGGE